MRAQSEVERLMRDAGWTLRRSRKHNVFGCPCGQHRITTPSSVVYGRAQANIASQLRRLQRQCVEQ